MPADNRYAFLVEWLDPQAQLVRQYLLFFYSIDGTVEMVSDCARVRLILILPLLLLPRQCSRRSVGAGCAPVAAAANGS